MRLPSEWKPTFQTLNHRVTPRLHSSRKALAQTLSEGWIDSELKRFRRRVGLSYSDITHFHERTHPPQCFIDYKQAVLIRHTARLRFVPGGSRGRISRADDLRH